MDFKQEFNMAFKELRCNKIRSILTMLGIIIGVSSIILLISVSDSMIKSINIQFDTLRSNGITVFIHPKNYKDKLNYNDAEELIDLENIKGKYCVTEGEIRVQYKTKNNMIKAVGTDKDYIKLKRLSMSKGRFIIYNDIENRSKVVVLGNKAANDIFENKNPVGEKIMLSGVPYKVIGVLCEEGGNLMGSCDDRVIFPISDSGSVLRTNVVNSIYIEAQDSKSVDKVVCNIRKRMRKIFKDDDDFKIINQYHIFKVVNKIQSTLKIVMGIIAGISLIVAGIGIMNIMLVAVNERTREIGIRKALGAKRKDILYQFLIEALVISLLGGIIGSVIGCIGSFFINNILEVPYDISWISIFVSISFSMVIGVIFGIIPADKASKLKPIDALRYE